MKSQSPTTRRPLESAPLKKSEHGFEASTGFGQQCDRLTQSQVERLRAYEKTLRDDIDWLIGRARKGLWFKYLSRNGRWYTGLASARLER